MNSTATPSLNTPFKRSIRRVALACKQCRSRKARCDSGQPSCQRCRADEKECEYQKSRRGGRPRRPTTVPIQPAVNESLSSILPTRNFGHSTDSNSFGHGSSGTSTTQSTLVDQLLAQYYTYFHVSHPCVLPRWALETKMAPEEGISGFLLPVLFYIGSVFAHSALLVYSIAVYWCDEPERGRELLDECINGAFILGMHQKGFAMQNGNGYPVLEESWRRTLWQIHVTDIHIASSTHSYQGLSVQFPITTEFPCEEECYETGVSFRWRTYCGKSTDPSDNRSFRRPHHLEAAIEFSSFAHLIGFTHGICRNAKVTCANADTMMMGWCSLLPASKRRLSQDDGSVDELLFKANILIHTCIVDLHRQLSNLQYSAIESVSKCAPPPPPESNHAIKEDAPIHTSKVLYAPKLSLERDKIRLNMGVLKMLGEFCPAGQREYKSIGTIAREILALKEEEIQVPVEMPILALDALDYNFPDFEINWAFLFEEIVP
ncbi:hypothetical protein P171DRAFT_457312 [Karstenula rhodostoma CBS 690.94]|uniref:Zn(2)-C6 fungal-type domain-containing protein n=1 Tax=Karstenula rhodostoma CBS 690.94 TaxID=1392251 RepID=A0A9P4PAD6_9PLEO|nr:hypothetical protein P171DRAFT_457312 [Karstenula rhodostoma CBS 690.94]